MQVLTSIPQDVVADLKIKTYIVYDPEDKPICAYRRIDNSFSFECVTEEYLDKYNNKIAEELAEKERKKKETQAKRIHTKHMNETLSNMTKEEQIEFLKNELIKLNS